MKPSSHTPVAQTNLDNIINKLVDYIDAKFAKLEHDKTPGYNTYDVITHIKEDNDDDGFVNLLKPEDPEYFQEYNNFENNYLATQTKDFIKETLNQINKTDDSKNTTWDFGKNKIDGGSIRCIEVRGNRFIYN